MNRASPYIVFIFLFMVNACTVTTTTESQQNDDLIPNEIPEISFLNISDTVVKQYVDSIAFSISYRDGDGDLGTTDPDATVIELVDSRDAQLLVFGYHLSPRAPQGTAVAIEGSLDIVLNNTILLDQNNDSESTTFLIRVVDREGQWSNQVESPVVTINK